MRATSIGHAGILIDTVDGSIVCDPWFLPAFRGSWCVFPRNDQLSRVGDMLCGQAMMAAADTAMVLALISHFGAFRPCTTVQMNTSFLKPLSGQDAIIEARLLRAGKALAFGEIDIRGADGGKSVCRASTTYALL